MVAESKPARRRLDSTSRSKSRRRGLTLSLAAAALAGIVATPIAANAGVDPADGLQAVLDFAGGDSQVDAGADSSSAAASASGRPAARTPAQTIDDESSGLSVRVSPADSTSISLAGPVAITVEIENATGEALAPALVRLVHSGGSIDDDADLDDWLASGSGDGAAIGGSTVTLAEGESRGLAAGSATVLSFTLPAGALNPLADSPVIGIGAEVVVGDAIVASGTDAFPNADVPAAGSVAVTLVAPLTAPIAGGGTGLIDAAQLENWTGPTGLLTRQLDALAGRRVAIGLDPRVIASIRVLGSSAPASASAWLERLANLPNEVFPLAYADADIAVQAQLGLPELLAPTSLTDVLDPANFATPADQGDGAAGDAGGGGGAPATDAPAEPEPTPGDVPTTDELLEWPYTRTDIGWPADDTVATGDLAFLDSVGLTTALLAAGNAEPVGGAASSSANIEGSTALVADAALTEALRAASIASTDTEWRAETGMLMSELALDAGVARTTVLATFDRGAPARSDRVSALIDQIGGSAWSTLASLADAIGAPPETRMLIDRPEPADRLAAVQRMVDAEADVAAFATVLADDRLLTGPTRRGLLSLLDVAWLDDAQAWNASVADWLATQRNVLGAVSVVPSSTINVVSTETGVPATVDNTLPYPVTVVVDVDPSNGRLIVEDPVEVTVEAQSRSTVRVPVEAGVGNGEVSLDVSLSSPEGVPIGSTVTIPANVQADWEGLGAAILATIAVLVFGIGIWRNIRRRRRERSAASTDAARDADSTDAAAGAESSESSESSETPEPAEASEDAEDLNETAAATHIEASEPRRD